MVATPEPVLPFNEALIIRRTDVYGRPAGKPSVSLFIREMLRKLHYDYVWHLYSVWKEYCATKTTKRGARMGMRWKYARYNIFRNYVWRLKKLGLIEKAYEKPADGEHSFPRAYYRLVSLRVNHPAWRDPSAALYARKV